MITVLSSPKPGSGTTTTAALLALAVRHVTTHTHVVDLCGDLTAVLGVTHTTSPTTHITDRLTAHDLTGNTAGEQTTFIRRLAALGEHVVIDAGSPTHATVDRLPDGTVRRWVLRPCFLGLRNATACLVRPDEVIVLEELGRALTARDVEAVTGAPVTATIEIHPQIARAVDAGLLTAKPPVGALAALRQLATPKAA